MIKGNSLGACRHLRFQISRIKTEASNSICIVLLPFQYLLLERRGITLLSGVLIPLHPIQIQKTCFDFSYNLHYLLDLYITP